MIRLLPALLFPAMLLAPTAVTAAERTYAITSFDRIRVDGPFEVRIETGKSPAARATADARTLEQLRLSVEGTTLIVRIGNEGWGETPTRARTAPVITLTTPALRGVSINSGAILAIARMGGQRIDLSVSGTGSIAVAAVESEQVNATIIGAGTISLAGRASWARLMTNGSGSIDAEALTTGDLVVRLDGTGSTSANARFTASVTTTGLGGVTVTGNAKCTVRAMAGGPVTCGKP